MEPAAWNFGFMQGLFYGLAQMTERPYHDVDICEEEFDPQLAQEALDKLNEDCAILFMHVILNEPNHTPIRIATTESNYPLPDDWETTS